MDTQILDVSDYCYSEIRGGVKMLIYNKAVGDRSRDPHLPLELSTGNKIKGR